VGIVGGNGELPGVAAVDALARAVHHLWPVLGRLVIEDSECQTGPWFAGGFSLRNHWEQAPENIPGLRLRPPDWLRRQNSDELTDLPRRPPAAFCMPRSCDLEGRPSSGAERGSSWAARGSSAAAVSRLSAQAFQAPRELYIKYLGPCRASGSGGLQSLLCRFDSEPWPHLTTRGELGRSSRPWSADYINSETHHAISGVNRSSVAANAVLHGQAAVWLPNQR
jgi:hypothetical protein